MSFFSRQKNVVKWLILYGIFWGAFAEAKTYQSHHLNQGKLIVVLDEAELHFNPVSSNAVEVVFEKPHVKQLPSFALAESSVKSAFEIKNDHNLIVFGSANLQVHIQKKPFTVSYYQGSKLLTRHAGGFFHYDALRGVSFKLQKQEKLLGGGQRVLGMDRRGHRLSLYNRTYWGYSDHADGMYYSLPAIMSSNQYILVFDNSAKGYLDLGKSNKDVLQFEAVAGRNAYILVAGNDYPELMDNFTEVTGKQPMPPRWALGSLSSRFGYRNESEVRSVVDEFKKQNFPLDAVILDIFWFGKEVKGHMGSLDWDREAFPTPESMIQDFQQQNIKTLLVTEPYIINSSKQWESALTAGALAKNTAGETKEIDMFFGVGGLVDVFNPDAQDWFWQFYHRQFEQGIAGVWGDLGEPEAHPVDTIHAIGSANEVHNAFGHQWAQFIYEKHQRHYPDKRLFMLMRAGFVGSQRFGMLPWTGDVERTWGGLGAQVELSLQMSILGLAYTHSDLGGFARNEVFDSELYIRWLQYGVFQPIYRLHGLESVAPEPIYHDKQTQDIVRESMQLRYQLLPYNYTLSYQNSTSGIPMMRPLFFSESDNPDVIDYKAGYFWGDAFWVSPVTSPNKDTQDVYLPNGYWFNFWNDDIRKGGESYTSKLSLNSIPVWVKAGSFIPMAHPINNTELYNGSDIYVHYYHHPEAKQSMGQLFEDDGKDRNSIAEQNYALFEFSSHFTLNQSKNVLQINVQKRGHGYATEPNVRHLKWIIHNIHQLPENVIVNGKSIASGSDNEVVFNKEKQQLVINTDWVSNAQQMQIEVILSE